MRGGAALPVPREGGVRFPVHRRSSSPPDSAHARGLFRCRLGLSEPTARATCLLYTSPSPRD
eukprot:14694816-Alexandrium_andersonii.AAC.1